MRTVSKRAVIISCLLAIGMGYYYFFLLLPRAHAVRADRDLMRGYSYGCDFYPVWLTSHELLFHRTNPYTPEMTETIQMGLFGRIMDPRRPGDPLQNLAVFPHPLYTDFLISPLAFVSFPIVQAVGSVLFPGFVVAGIFLWLRIFNLRLTGTTLILTLVLILSSYPILEGIYALQLSLLVAALLAGSVAALVKDRPVWAGVLLAMATVKPQLVLLPGSFLVLWAAYDLKSRNKFWLSLIATLAILFLAGEAILPGWTATWLRALLEYRQYNDPPVSQLMFGKIFGGIVSFSLIAMAAVLAFRARRANANSQLFALTVGLLMAITVPTIPSSIAVYNQVLLIPMLLWLFFRSESTPRILAWTVGLLICWQWVAASGVTVLFLFYPTIRNLSWMLVLPLRTASSVPFAVIALSFWMVWKTKSAQREVMFTPAKSPEPCG